MTLSFPAQYPNIYAYGHGKALQVLPDAIAPTFAAEMATAKLGGGPRAPYCAVPLSAAASPKSKYNASIAASRKRNAPQRRRRTHGIGDSAP